MLTVILGAGAITASLLLLCWTLLGANGSPSATRNLMADTRANGDLRDAVLARSAHERAVQPAVAVLARYARRLTPGGRLDQLEQRILLAGAAQGWPLERVLAAKVVLAAAGALLSVMRFLKAPTLTNVLLGAATTALFFWIPDILLVKRADKRKEAVRMALPDTLDQLTITVEAGLAFEAAVARSARTTKGPLADELLRMLQDVQAGMSRREALKGLAARVDVPELRTFVTSVIQADQYGVPIGQVLRVQSTEQRVKRSQRAEEKAMKLPVKLLFPTVLFIFPVLFIVLLGPAVIQMGRAF